MTVDPQYNDLGYTQRGRDALAEFLGLIPVDHPQLWKDSQLARQAADRHGATASACGCVSAAAPSGYPASRGFVVLCGRHRRAEEANERALRLNPPGRSFRLAAGDGWDASSISD